MSGGFGDALSQVLEKPLKKRKVLKDIGSDPILALDRRTLKDARSAEKLQSLGRLRKLDKEAKHSRCHVVPDISTDAALEKQLVRIATKGVVTLFNAVTKHQTDLQASKKASKTKSGNSNSKSNGMFCLCFICCVFLIRIMTVVSSSLSKSSFLDMLKGTAPNSVESPSNPESSVSKAKGSWLSDDFMMQSKFRDWKAV